MMLKNTGNNQQERTKTSLVTLTLEVERKGKEREEDWKEKRRSVPCDLSTFIREAVTRAARSRRQREEKISNPHTAFKGKKKRGSKKVRSKSASSQGEWKKREKLGFEKKNHTPRCTRKEGAERPFTVSFQTGAGEKEKKKGRTVLQKGESRERSKTMTKEKREGKRKFA